ncbi:MAG: hypothetical protein JWR26_836 [Pedosphaera sp.]|nr:hypothetical protein [Pedosphaera sp.]
MAMAALFAGAMVAQLASCSAQGADTNDTNNSQPHFPGQAPGEAQKVLRRFEGSVTAVDSKAMTLTIKSKDGDHKFKVSSKTKFSRGDKPASLSDAAVGQPVEVVVKSGRGQPDEVITVNIKDK